MMQTVAKGAHVLLVRVMWCLPTEALRPALSATQRESNNLSPASWKVAGLAADLRVKWPEMVPHFCRLLLMPWGC